MEKTNGMENRTETSLLLSDKDTQDSRRIGSLGPCQICGSMGFENLIISCFHCRQVQEHIYCARKPLPYVPDIWLCEECRLGNNETQRGIDKEECFPTTSAPHLSERDTDCPSEPENFSDSSHDLRILRVDDVVEPKISTQLDVPTSSRGCIYAISRRGCLGLMLQPHTCLEGNVAAEEQQPPFEAFPSPKKKRRTLRLTGSANISVKTTS